MSEENEIFWANQVQQLPHRALETLVRDIRTEENKALHAQRHSLQKDTQDKIPLELQLTAEIKQKLLELQQKGIDINKLLQNFLDQREEKIENEKKK